MAAEKPRFTKRILLFVVLGFLMLVLYLHFLVGTVNLADVLGRTNLIFYASAFVAFLVSVLFTSLAWQSLLGNLAVEIKLRRVLLFTWFGMFFDAIVPDPGWSGDLSKAYMLAKASGQETGRIVASVVGQKIILMTVTVFDLILGLAVLAIDYTLPSVVLIFVAFVAFLSTFSLIILSYLSSKPKATKRILNWLIRAISFVRRSWNSQNFRLRAEKTLSTFHEGTQTLISAPRTLIHPFAFSFLGWGFDVLVIFLTFVALGYPVRVDQVLIVYALTGSLQIVGLSFVGFAEIIISSSYAVLGVPLAVSLSATLLTRVVTLWFKLVVSYAAFQWEGVKFLSQRNSEVSLPKIR